jgi:hypothetical protein
VNRKVARALLFAAGIFAAAVPLIALRQLGGSNPVAWAALSASLAVLASVVSAWTSRRVLELQEDALEPNPVPWIDMRSRYQLAQFKISNRGGSTAYNVQLSWDQPLENTKREQVLLGVTTAIPMIGAGDEASTNLGLDFEYMQVLADTTRTGTIKFLDKTGKNHSRPFKVSAEHERAALSYNHERTKTEYELQQIPSALAKIAGELQRLNQLQEDKKDGATK